MKLLYLTVPSYFDLEISLIRELSLLCDVKVVMFVTPASMKSSAFSIDHINPTCGLIPAKEYLGLEKYRDLINLNDWIIANNPNNSIPNAIRLTIELNKYSNSFHPDIVHFTSFNFNLVGSIIFLKNKFKRILTIHDVEPHSKQKLIKKFLRYISIQRCRNILLLSEPPKQELLKLSKSTKKILYSRLGPYDFLKNYIGNSRNQNMDKYILFFGRIEAYKGVDLLIRSFEKSKAIKDGAKLVIAGKGKIDNIDNISSKNNNIIFINRYIDNAELANLIFNSKYIVLPYRSATQSGVIMSAFALNKPSIVTNVGNLPEAIGFGKYGCVIPPNDENELTRKIDELYFDSEQLSIFKLNIENDFSNDGKYSWKRIAFDLLHNYMSIANDDINHS